jgi:hypothetical protein
MAPTRPAKNFKAGQSHRSSSPSDDEDFEDGVIEESALDPVKIAQDMLKSVCTLFMSLSSQPARY